MGDFWLVDMSRLSGRLSMHACIPRGPTVTRVPPEKAARTRQTAISTQIMQQQKVVGGGYRTLFRAAFNGFNCPSRRFFLAVSLA